MKLSKKEKDKIILDNLGLIKKVASKIYYKLPDCEIDFDDLVHIGILGMYKAIENYEKEKGAFSTYAYIRVRGEILDYLRELDIMPKMEKEKIITEYADKIGDQLPLSKHALVLSLDKALNEEENISLLDTISSKTNTPEEEISRKEIIEKILQNIDKYLDENEKKIIYYLYFEEKDPKEISEILNISLGRISQLKSRAIEKLKKVMYDII